jgi:hypothetical protein
VKGVKRAISIRQPYAEQILQRKKLFEYRSKLTRIRERVYIYAALKEAIDADEGNYKLIGKDFASLPKGKIIGTVEIVGCFRNGNKSYKYELGRPRRLSKYLLPKNQPQPGFWIPRFRRDSVTQ